MHGITLFSILSQPFKKLIAYYNSFPFIIGYVCMPNSSVGQHFKIQKGRTWPPLLLHSVYGWFSTVSGQWCSVGVCWLCRGWGGSTIPLPFALVMVEVRCSLSESLHKSYYTHLWHLCIHQMSLLSLPSWSYCQAAMRVRAFWTIRPNVFTQICHILVKQNPRFRTRGKPMARTR